MQAIHARSLKLSPWIIQILVAGPLSYVCVCTFFSLFKLGSLGPYHMVPRATWSWSLLLNASLLARFAAPLCFNYLHVIRMTGHQRGGRSMAFVDLMGMEDVPLLGAAFNTWFPLVMVLYVAILTTGIFEQCFTSLFVPPKLRFDSEKADDEHSSAGQDLLIAEQENFRRGGDFGGGSGIFGMKESKTDDINSVEFQRRVKDWNHAHMSIQLGTSKTKYSSTQRLYTGEDSSQSYNDATESAGQDSADLLFAGIGRRRD